MAPGRTPKPKRAQPAPEPTPSELEKLKADNINLGDSVALKRALDDAVTEVVQNEGWKLDHNLIDLKLGVGLLA